MRLRLNQWLFLLAIARLGGIAGRSGFDPSLALQFIERGVVPLPFALQEPIDSASSLFRRHENVPASLADTALIRLAEIND